MRLANLVVAGDDARDDKLLWGPDANEVFSVRGAYNKICATNTQKNYLEWKKVWSLKVQQRIKLFVWLLAHRKLLTNQTRHKRHITDNPL